MNKNIFQNKVTAGLLAIISTLLWGSAFPVLKMSFHKLNISAGDIRTKIYFAGMRFFIAAIILFLIMKFILKMDLLIKLKNLPGILLVGLLQTTIAYFFFYVGLGNTSGIKASILISSGTFLTIIFAHFIYHDDKIDRKKIIGMIVGLLGIIIINIEKLPLELNFTFTGEGFLILCGLSTTFATFLVKRISKKVEPFKLTSYQLFIGSIFLLLLGDGSQLNFTLETTALLIYAALISSIGFGLWFSLLKYNKAGEITLFKFIIPISGASLSAIILPNEAFTFNIIISLVLVSIGIIFINLKS